MRIGAVLKITRILDFNPAYQGSIFSILLKNSLVKFACLEIILSKV